MINFLNLKKSDYHESLFSSTLKKDIIKQAASMLLQHVKIEKKFHHLTQNANTNAFDEYQHHQIRRTNKCNSWLSKFPTKSDISINRLPIFIEPPLYKRQPRFSHKQLTLSSNATPNIDPPIDTFSQPFILIHKKRLRRDYFLSTMQNCIQPPYSHNHFYAFDQLNMLKLQQNNYFNSKRKYSEIYDNDEVEIDLNQTSLSSKPNNSPPKTADNISINKYHDDIKIPLSSDNKSNIEKQESEIILTRLEKILNLCGELRTLANDVENHLNEKQSIVSNKNKRTESDQTLIDIYKELEIQQTVNEKDTSPPPYQTTNDISSIHSESNQSYPLMQTESFKTKSISYTTLRKPEDICSCFLKSLFDKENYQLNNDEKEYLNQLTKAYLLGKEQILKQQHEENNKFQAFINETFPDEQNQFDDPSSLNNNQLAILFNKKSLSSISIKSNHSIISLNHQQSSISSTNLTVKHQIFINEPIAMKTINVLPGIGIKYAQQLAENGFSTVRRLLGFYLMMKDDQNFVNWLNNKVQISTHSAWLCTNALRAWCQTHL